MTTPAQFEEVIIEHSRREAPREACGFVFEPSPGHLKAAPATNAAEQPEHFFRIPAEEHLAAVRSGGLLGYYHSHPLGNSAPSDADITNAEETGLISWIWGAADNVLSCYIPKGLRTPLIGRRFCPMVHDCVSLVWDFWRESGNELPPLPRKQSNYQTGIFFDWTPWIEQFHAQIVAKPEPGDVLLMCLHGSTRPNHMAVYAGLGIMVHQVASKPSGREVWGGQWKKHTTMILRLPGAFEAARRLFSL